MGLISVSALPGDETEARFDRLYAEHGRAVFAFVLRRTAGREDAADLVAEAFLAAWRRADEIPPEPEARLWLFGIARGLLSNAKRGKLRRARLEERLKLDRATTASSEASPESEPAVTVALERLAPQDREVLTLVGWEGLEPAEIARVLGVSQVAARSRLHRARRRFLKELAAVESAGRPVPVDGHGREGRTG